MHTADSLYCHPCFVLAVPGTWPEQGPFCYSNRRRRPTLSHLLKQRNRKMAPLLGSLLPSDFININGHDPDTIFFLATKQPFHSQVGLFNGTATV
ncbi:hypothetical protein N7489_004591 [Penicillium chrysogenum]|uniref:Uncharacterized protein n=1 Tax=Penicillium chrysogenum TaxID=5076 RepID=A0A167T5Q2_PENCH|nr:uncharacterized protein N7489_004591 [Penicillium chrysogenum]KAJ5244495.1 hypothetical protein N7489_004591 [Penicillium chrysogenum]KAJ5852961.1 hypothetical protein N7534_005504 [Penicillium rubens]KZN87910.1 hypothetical protein EN45_064710 [Penicillium chrysogenum]